MILVREFRCDLELVSEADGLDMRVFGKESVIESKAIAQSCAIEVECGAWEDSELDVLEV